ncbi:MAG: ATP-dependent helicase [Paenibacillaceae bacterium]|nr:ATP-dependent helicase [Paenibacillaceae bacterium]
MTMELHSVPVRKIAGVGVKKAGELLAMGVSNVGQLLEYYPFRYEDYTPQDPAHLEDGMRHAILGTVYSEPSMYRYGAGRARLSCRLVANPLLFTAVWFNQTYLQEQLRVGRKVLLVGKWEASRRLLTVTETVFPDAQGASELKLQPVYPLSGNITQRWLRKTIRQALEQYGDQVKEVLPEPLRAQNRFLSRKQSVHAIHLPEGEQESQKARESLVYEELFLFQLKLQSFRSLSRKQQDGLSQTIATEEIRKLIGRLPYRLTEGQRESLKQILRDMRDPSCMNRLLQGDVGSGKTVVAGISLFATVRAGFQGALMAPTELLAEQHQRSLETILEDSSIRIELLTGSLTDRKRKDVLSSLQVGEIDIVVGTHALIQDDVYFHKLGLVVIDEQHRFGVRQRAQLRNKGMNPDILTMTATPIPRTLAITAFGDIDISTIRELPAGRKPIKTYAVKHDMLERVLKFIHKETRAGRQAYVICPLIEESQKLDVQNAEQLYRDLAGKFPDLNVGLLHGRMDAEDKHRVMSDFAANRLQVLVSTTVIEVGVDVPNATLMVVYDADRFGLSQMHQLRGRVGRGPHQSFCILIADPKNAVGEERLKAMTVTNDGFEIANLDLAIRGPGEFFGAKQSGIPPFRLADLTRDYRLLEQARDDAAKLLASPEFWTEAVYLPLRELLRQDQSGEREPLN